MHSDYACCKFKFATIEKYLDLQTLTSVSLVKMAVPRPVPTQWDPLNVDAILDISWLTINLPAMVKIQNLMLLLRQNSVYCRIEDLISLA